MRSPLQRPWWRPTNNTLHFQRYHVFPSKWFHTFFLTSSLKFQNKTSSPLYVTPLYIRRFTRRSVGSAHDDVWWRISAGIRWLKPELSNWDTKGASFFFFFFFRRIQRDSRVKLKERRSFSWFEYIRTVLQFTLCQKLCACWLFFFFKARINKFIKREVFFFFFLNLAICEISTLEIR